MPFYHKITCIFMIYVYLSRTFFVAIYALFPPIFWPVKQTPPIFSLLESMSKTYLIFVTKFTNETCGDKSVMWRNFSRTQICVQFTLFCHDWCFFAWRKFQTKIVYVDKNDKYVVWSKTNEILHFVMLKCFFHRIVKVNGESEKFRKIPINL